MSQSVPSGRDAVALRMRADDRHMPSMAPMNRMQVALRMRADDRKSCGVLLSQMDAVALRMRADDGQSLNFPNSMGLVSPCERGGLPMRGEALEYSR